MSVKRRKGIHTEPQNTLTIQYWRKLPDHLGKPPPDEPTFPLETFALILQSTVVSQRQKKEAEVGLNPCSNMS